MFKEMPLDNVENLWYFEFIFMWFGNILQYLIVSNSICCPSINKKSVILWKFGDNNFRSLVIY